MSGRTQKRIAGVIVFEKRPYWGPELKRQYSDQPILVRECRSVHELLPLSEVAETVLILTLDAAPHDCLIWLANQFQNHQKSPVVVISPVELADLEWPVREAGVAAFVSDEIAGHRLANVCRRLMRSNSAVVFGQHMGQTTRHRG